MINTKQDYESPTTKVIELRFPSVICSSGQFGINDWDNNENDFPGLF